jgi:hypothetical protein
MARASENGGLMSRVKAKAPHCRFQERERLGPANCLRTRQAPEDCRTCGAKAVTIRHTPLRMAGSHCEQCCPCCALAVRPNPQEER